MGVIAAYRRVFRNGPLTRLLVGEFVSSIGDWLYLVALLVLIWNESGDPLALGIIGAARIVPYILLSVPAGIVADRFDRRLILLITDIARGLIMLAMAGLVIVGAPIDGHRRAGHPRDLLLGLLLADHRRLPARAGRRRGGARTGQQRLVEPRQPGLLHRAGLRGASAGPRARSSSRSCSTRSPSASSPSSCFDCPPIGRIGRAAAEVRRAKARRRPRAGVRQALRSDCAPVAGLAPDQRRRWLRLRRSGRHHRRARGRRLPGR